MVYCREFLWKLKVEIHFDWRLLVVFHQPSWKSIRKSGVKMQKNVKFHHLVSNLKVKKKGEVVLGKFNFKLGQLQKPFGKKNHPPFPFGSKNSPQKISSPSLSPTERLIQENPRSCQVFRISQGSETNRNHPPGVFRCRVFRWKNRNGSETFCGCFFFVFPRYRSLHWFNGSHQWPESTKKIIRKGQGEPLEIIPLKRTPEKKKKKNGTAYEWRMDFFGGGPVTWGYIAWGWLFGFASIGADLKGFGDGHVSRMPIFDGSTVIFLLVNKR